MDPLMMGSPPGGPEGMPQGAMGMPAGPPQGDPMMPRNKPIQPDPNATVGGVHNRAFEAPIPGQSLTRTPGQYPFEHPPQFNTVDEAMEAILNALADSSLFNQLLNLIELDVPLTAISGTLLMQGFAEGKWTPDVAMLMHQPTVMLLMKLAKEAGIKPVLGEEKEEDPTMDMVAQKRLQKFAAEAQEEVTEAAPTGGFMAPMGE